MASRGYLVSRAKKPNSLAHKFPKGRRKKKIPPWDNSISNLSIYKPTAKALRQRHEMHQPIPRNLDLVCASEEHSSTNDIGILKTPESVNDLQRSISREMMYSNGKLQDALIYNDQRLSAVQDLFGDDPKKFRGFPNITDAPIQGEQREVRDEAMTRSAFMKEPSFEPSNLDILSDTIMDETALNEVTDVKGFDGKKNNSKTLVTASSETSEYHQLSQKCVRTMPARGASNQDCRPPTTEPSPVDETLSSRLPSSKLFEDVPATSQASLFKNIVDVKHGNRQVEKNEEKTTQSKSINCDDNFRGIHELRQTSTPLLIQMVNDLETQVRKFEEETYREHSTSTTTKEKESFGGFTVSILNAVTKLVGYLRECEVQRKADMAIKEELFHGFQQQQILIDALTNDVISMQEKNKKLLTYQNRTNQEIDHLKREFCAVLKNCDTMPKDQTSKRATNLTRSEQPGLQPNIRENQILRDRLEIRPSMGCRHENDLGALPGRNTEGSNNGNGKSDTTGTNEDVGESAESLDRKPVENVSFTAAPKNSTTSFPRTLPWSVSSQYHSNAHSSVFLGRSQSTSPDRYSANCDQDAKHILIPKLQLVLNSGENEKYLI